MRWCLSLFLAFVFSSAFSQQSNPVTAAGAEKLVQDSERDLFALGLKLVRAGWVQENFITTDTEQIAADANDDFTAAATRYAKEAFKYDTLQQLPYDTLRKLMLLKIALTIPAPSNDAERQELSRLLVKMDGDYGRGKFCPTGEKNADGQPKCYTLNDAEKIMRESRDPVELKKMWLGWHSIGAAMRPDYARFVELSHKGARELGYPDVGALWRSNYDMPPEQFAAEQERLWRQLKPFYDSLHAYVRTRLHERYGTLVPESGPIPADLLGNMWAQDWSNIYPLVAPPNADPGYDLTKILQQRHTDPKQMVRYGESFYVSLGFDKLPDTFWERSLLEKPKDRDVVCHASAWDVDAHKDVRIKACIEPTEEYFITVHHELGHNYYQMAYAGQSPAYQGGANDGFHEAIGDTIAKSVTPSYLKQIGLIDTVPDASKDLGVLMHQALEKIAFLPFAYVVDQWRWKVFAGEIKPEDYNKSWWDLRLKYQGIVPPVDRSEKDFDPGAKYHVASNTPYARYFIASVLQFQFHRDLCKIAGYEGPLHRCSIYNNKAAGAALKKMLAMGQSRPWPEALQVLTGEDRMDATAILDYFATLKKWLDEQNRNHKVGW